MNNTTNSVSSTDSSYYSQSLYTPSSGNISVMYYIMQAMMAKLDSSKQCLTDDKDDQLKQEIEQMLEGIDSVDGKEKLLAYLKTVMKDADPEIIGWLNEFYNQVQNYQQQIDAGILKYQDALDKLNKALEQGSKAQKDADLEYQRYVDALQAAKNFKTDPKKPWTYAEKAALYVKAAAIYTAYKSCEATAKFLESKAIKWVAGVNEAKNELNKEKQALEDQIQALLDKSEHSTKDLVALQNAFNQLIKVVQGQIESTGLYKAIKWLKAAGDKDIERQQKMNDENAENEYPGGGPGVLADCDYGIASLLGLFNHFGGHRIDKDEINMAQIGKAVVNIELTVGNIVDGLTRLNQQAIGTAIQLNSKARDDYSSGEKQIQELAEIFGYVLANNKI